MVAQPNDPIQIVEYLNPANMWTNTRADGKFVTVYDMGQNMVGWCSVSVLNTNGAGLSGYSVTLRHAEALQPDTGNYGASAQPRPTSTLQI